MNSVRDDAKAPGCPIRKSTDQCLLAAPHGLSQRATSFIASRYQGIHQMPLKRLRCRRHAQIHTQRTSLLKHQKAPQKTQTLGSGPNHVNSRDGTCSLPRDGASQSGSRSTSQIQKRRRSPLNHVKDQTFKGRTRQPVKVHSQKAWWPEGQKRGGPRKT